ncbi:MAG: peptide chain release factor N(5)-glutamine methyltransferase [Zoogloeaceae bacterium]|jgi:release factor glutamine methyltransferase|nr:peptide chain release factor N(5)-glutamine methyltransferase [Zoogloeaceae bacterium]
MNVRAWLLSARDCLDDLDARLLLQHVTGLSHADLIVRPETPLTDTQAARLEMLRIRRVNGEPLAYLTETAGFHGRLFRVTPAVLTPRPETEELVDLALEKLAGIAAPRVLDLGAGSGAIAITLALECPRARVSAVERSQAALEIAAQNGRDLGAQVRWLAGDWFAPLAATPERQHLIVANPPYLAADDPHLAGDGVAFEPRSALTDEADGLQCIRHIVVHAPRYLEKDGCLLLEHGYTQGKAVRRLLRAAGFQDVQTWRDLGKHERMSSGVLRTAIPVCPR